MRDKNLSIIVYSIEFKNNIYLLRHSLRRSSPKETFWCRWSLAARQSSR